MRLNKITVPALIILIPILLALSNVLIVAYDENFLIEQALFFSAQDPDSTNAIVLFLQGESSLPAALTELETTHMHDVRSRIATATTVFSVLALFAAFLIAAEFTGNTQEAWKKLEHAAFRGALLTIALFVAAFFALSNFTKAFSAFHIALFAPGSYIFPPSGKLVSLFPEAFFQFLAMHIALAILLQALVIVLLLLVPKLFDFPKQITHNV